jgi:signal transduction histidine kinase
MGIRDFRARLNEVMQVTRRDVAALTSADSQRIITALQLRQIELEVQNETLRNALQQSELTHRGESEFFDSVPLGCLRLGASGEVTRGNAAAFRLLHVSRADLIGHTLSSLIVGEERWLFDALLHEARQYTVAVAELTIQIPEAGRTRIQLEVRALPDVNVEYIVTLTEPVQPQTAHLRDSWRDLPRRFQAFGQLAAGIAHDFNNLLVSVLGNADLLALMPGISSEWSERLSMIMDAGRQGSDLTRQLLILAATSKLNATKLNLQVFVSEQLQQHRARLAPRVELHAQICMDMAPVQVDGEQIGLALRSLLDNAIEATGGAGAVTVQTRTQTLDAAELETFVLNSAAQPGEFAILQVHDTGPGIDAGTLECMFDPYFSTKPGHRGLGLALVLGIVQGHCGAIRVQTQLGGGARFEIALPTNRSSVKNQIAPLRARHGEVLLIDDDDAVRKVVGCLLEIAGFEVTQAAGGIAGLALYRAGRERFKALVLDWVMPDCCGKQVLAEVRRMDPHFPVVVISGYCSEDLDAQDEHMLRLAKPMTFHQLCGAIQALTGIQGLAERAN